MGYDFENMIVLNIGSMSRLYLLWIKACLAKSKVPFCFMSSIPRMSVMPIHGFMYSNFTPFCFHQDKTKFNQESTNLNKLT